MLWPRTCPTKGHRNVPRTVPKKDPRKSSQDPWAYGQGKFQGNFQGQFQGKIQGNCRSCQVDGLNQTDQCKEYAGLIYANQQ